MITQEWAKADRPMSTRDVAAALDCSYSAAFTIMKHYGHRQNEDKPHSNWWIKTSEFEQLRKDGVLILRAKHIEGQTRQEYRKAYRAKRKEARICANCGQPIPNGYDRTVCPSCAEWRRKKYRATKYSISYDSKKRYRARKRAGVCTCCQAELPQEWTHVLCLVCYERHRTTQKRLIDEKKAEAKKNGVCYSCGRDMEGDDHVSCIICREKRAKKWKQYYHDKYMERKREGKG